MKVELIHSMYPCQGVPVAVFNNRCTSPCLYCGLYKYQFPENSILATGKENVIREMAKYKGAYFSPVTDCFLPENSEMTCDLIEETWKINSQWVPFVNTKQAISERALNLFLKNKNRLVLQISIPASGDHLVSIIEPGSLLVSERFKLLKRLNKIGVPVIAVIMPWFDLEPPEEFVKKLSETGVMRVIIANGILTEKTKQRMIHSGIESLIKVANSVCFVKEATENGLVLPKDQRIKSLTEMITALTNSGIKVKVCISDNHDLGNTGLPLCGKFRHHNFQI